MIILYSFLGAALFLTFCLFVLWAGNTLLKRKPKPQQTKMHLHQFKERMLNPDFKSFEDHFGHAVPPALYDLYRNKEMLLRNNFHVAPTTETPDCLSHHIAFYEPCDKDTINTTWPGLEHYFRFADDGCGNCYLIDPKQDNPAVLFFAHETGELSEICRSLAEFLLWPRKDSS